MRREKKIEYNARIAYNWRDLIYNTKGEGNIMLYYETEHKKYGVYCMEYILDCWECTELIGEYPSRRLAERVASVLNEMYDDLYIVEEL